MLKLLNCVNIVRFLLLLDSNVLVILKLSRDGQIVLSNKYRTIFQVVQDNFGNPLRWHIEENKTPC